MRNLLFAGALAPALALATSPPALADPLPDAIAQLDADFDATLAPAPVAAATDAREASASNTLPGTQCAIELSEGTDTLASITAPVTLFAAESRLRPPNVSKSTSDGWAYFGRRMRLASAEHIDRSRFDPAAISLRRSAF